MAHIPELWPHTFGPLEEYTPEYLQYVNSLPIQWPSKPEVFSRDVRQYKVGDYNINEFFMRGVYEARKNFQAHEDDIFVASFPKTGTTWMQEIVYLVANDFNYEKAKSGLIMTRCPFIDVPRTTREAVANHPRPRVIQTHLGYQILPQSVMDKKCKIIYITRNPKDTAVSIYNFYKLLTVFYYESDFKDFWPLFKEGFVFYGPYPLHVKSYWNHRNDDNILFMTYEGMKKDLAGSIRKVADFLGKKYTDKQIEEAAYHCSFEGMKQNPASNRSELEGAGIQREGTSFMRKGIVGDWKNNFDDETTADFEGWLKDNFSDTDLKFEYN